MLLYKITNIVNGKLYIGITSKTLKRRWQGHASAARRGRKNRLHSAIRKYGEENFIIELLQETQNYKELVQLEIDYISKLETTNKKIGYNMTIGGEGTAGYEFTDKDRRKMADNMTGKSYEDRFGKEKAQEIKAKKSLLQSRENNPCWKHVDMLSVFEHLISNPYIPINELTDAYSCSRTTLVKKIKYTLGIDETVNFQIFRQRKTADELINVFMEKRNELLPSE